VVGSARLIPSNSGHSRNLIPLSQSPTKGKIPQPLIRPLNDNRQRSGHGEFCIFAHVGAGIHPQPITRTIAHPYTHHNRKSSRAAACEISRPIARGAITYLNGSTPIISRLTAARWAFSGRFQRQRAEPARPATQQGSHHRTQFTQAASGPPSAHTAALKP